jgi:thiamine-phosphate pyrophosphorylase
MNNALLLYITDRTAFPGAETARRRRLLETISEAARCGVDYIQLREKDLSARELELLAREAVAAVRDNSNQKTENPTPSTVLLINSRTDIALAVGAAGVHLRSDDISLSEARSIWKHGAGNLQREGSPIISVACHSQKEVEQAAASQADFAVFAPVFEKPHSSTHPAGLDALRQACRAPVPVLALGGVTLDDAARCLAAGAAGIAAIRLFQEHSIADVAHRLRSL